jgi:DNA-3-methyladenine glycosylase I
MPETARPRITKPSPAKKRCSWCGGDPLLEHYHDTEWGVPEHDDDRLFERLALQIFQAGLNWKMILLKRPALKKAFRDFDIDRVARFDARSVNRLMNDAGIIRNRKKIEAVIENAKRLREIRKEYGSFDAWIAGLSSGLAGLQKEFRNRFAFMGPEITRMFVMNIGKVWGVHERKCFRYKR